MIVAAPEHPLAGRELKPPHLTAARWVMREPGSGTRSEFESAITERGIDPTRLDVIVALPTNEAVCAAVVGGGCVTVVSDLVVRAHVAASRLCVLRYALPTRQFVMLRHKERSPSKAGCAFAALTEVSSAQRGCYP